MNNNNKSVFFVSDYHFSHSNIIKYCNRPFKYIEEMNETLIANHNSIVKPDDEVNFLGDFGFSSTANLEKILSRLNGKFYFIIGNHDKDIMNSDKFNKVGYADILNIKGYPKIYLSHCCSRIWEDSHKGSWHLFGHSHGTLETDNMSIDVGVDSNDIPKKYFPTSLEDIQAIMNKRKNKMEKCGRYKVGYRALNERPYFDQDDVGYFKSLKH